MSLMYTSIVLSGLPGAGKTALAQRLSVKYQWPVYSIGELFRKEWKRRHPNGEISFEEFWRNTSLEEQRKVNLVAREIFAHGNIIGDTRYAVYCKDLPSLMIFVTADIDTRTLRAMRSEKYRGKNFHDIRSILSAREEDEVHVGKQLVGSWYDYRNPKHYHMVLDSGTLSLEEEVASINREMERG